MPSIDFYSGSKKKKTQGGGGVQFEILKKSGIDFYSGFRKTSQGGAILIPKKVDPPNLKTWIRLWYGPEIDYIWLIS